MSPRYLHSAASSKLIVEANVDGEETFTNLNTILTKKAGLDKYRGFWTGAAQGDYDHDGNVYLCNCGYVKALSCPLV